MSHAVGEIRIDRIKPSRFRLRDMDLATVEELARSIRTNGLLQPIMVKPAGDSYQLVFGFHRLEACKKLGWATIPAIVKVISDEESFLTSVVENLQRRVSINPVAEAQGYKHLIMKGWTVHEIAEKLGKSDSYVCERMRILDRLHPSILKRLRFTRVKPRLTVSHVERLSLVDDPELQISLCNMVEKHGLSVRKLESLTRRTGSKRLRSCLCPNCVNYSIKKKCRIHIKCPTRIQEIDDSEAPQVCYKTR